MGWKLAYLNLDEIAGKRGLIQRAVDSYRNRYPSMRSRRVARQEKLLKGTLRKRKHRDTEDQPITTPQKTSKTSHDATLVEKAPKTILIEDANIKCRIRINIESVVLDAIDIAFRKNNCVFPRAMHITSDTPCVTQRRLDEAKCNEIGWKLAWLNPRQLANKKNLLQRALDTYRNQFTTDLKPRKYASRIAPQPYVPPPTPPPPSPPSPPSTVAAAVVTSSPRITIKQEENYAPLTADALAEFDSTTMLSKRSRRDSNQSCYSGTTVTLDFHDYCFSPPAEDEDHNSQLIPTTSFDGNMFDDLILASLPLNVDDVLSEGSSSNTSQNLSSYQNTPSPESLMTFYQQALLLKTEESSLFLLDGQNDPEDDNNNTTAVVDFMTKYQSVVNAGMDDFSNDPALLTQLF